MSNARRIQYGRQSLTIRSSETQLSVRDAAIYTVRRAARLPIATLLGVLFTSLPGYMLAIAQRAGLTPAVTAFVGFLLGSAICLALAAIMSFDEKRLSHLASLYRTCLLTSLGLATVMGIPLILVIQHLPAQLLAYYQSPWLLEWLPYASIGIGATFLAGSLPAILPGWSLTASTGYPLTESIFFIWQEIEGRLYQPGHYSLLIAVSGITLSSVPALGILTPVLLAHMFAVTFRHFVTVRRVA